MSNELSVFTSVEGFEVGQRMAQALIKSSLVPQAYKDIGSSMIAIELAQRMNMSVLSVMQNMYIVHGKPGWSSSYLIAAFNATKRFSPITYEMTEEGTVTHNGKQIPNLCCRAVSKCLTSNKDIIGTKISLDMAIKEGWYQKSGSKWQTMPEQMLKYRSAAFMIRATAPEIACGFQTQDELNDTDEKMINVTPNNEVMPVAAPVKKAPVKQEETPIVIEQPIEQVPTLPPVSATDIEQIRSQLSSAREVSHIDAVMKKSGDKFLWLSENNQEAFAELNDLSYAKRQELNTPIAAIKQGVEDLVNLAENTFAKK